MAKSTALEVDKQLTPKQQLFVKEYLIDFNGTRAAIKAGYSENSAQQIASENLLKLVIQKELSKAISKQINKVEITVEYVLKHIKDIVENLNEKTADRLKALELLGKYLKLWVENQINIQINYSEWAKQQEE